MMVRLYLSKSPSLKKKEILAISMFGDVNIEGLLIETEKQHIRPTYHLSIIITMHLQQGWYIRTATNFVGRPSSLHLQVSNTRDKKVSNTKASVHCKQQAIATALERQAIYLCSHMTRERHAAIAGLALSANMLPRIISSWHHRLTLQRPLPNYGQKHPKTSALRHMWLECSQRTKQLTIVVMEHDGVLLLLKSICSLSLC